VVNRASSWQRVVVLCTFVPLCVGCHRVAKNALHITSVTPDAAVDVTGTLNGKVYELSVDRKGVPLYVAYYEPIDVPDVGRDFPAHIEAGSGEMAVQVPNKGTVRYSIQSVHEKN